MALVKFVRCAKSQTSGGLWGTLRYCCRENKTVYEGRQLVTGVNCVAETAFREFLNTKRLYEKTEGRQFYQMIQSFHPGENLTPQTAHEIALKLAEEFAGFEIVVATHTDREHIHSHFIINSVSADTGKKYHSNMESLQHLRDVSDALCREYGLSVIQPKQKKASGMSAREYRSADKGQSWKLRLAIAIDDAMAVAKSSGHFKRLMEAEGYEVRWSDDRKYITYTTPEGNRCRDIKLHERKYRKECMEHEFRIRRQILGGAEDPGPEADTGSGESDPLRESHREQLDGADLAAENPDHSAGTDFGIPENPDHQRGTGGLHEPAAGNSDPGHGAVPVYADGADPAGDRAVETELEGNGETGWEHERELFAEALRSTNADGFVYEDAVQNYYDSQPDLAAVGVGAVYLVSGASGSVDEDQKIEDSTTRHYPPERRNRRGHGMGGMGRGR